MARIIIDFPREFPQNTHVGVLLEGGLAEHEQIWVWDHFFSLMLNRMTDEEQAEALLETLALWAAGFAPKMLSPVNELHAEGALVIDKKLKLRSISGELHLYCVIEIQRREDNWPGVRVKLPDDMDQRHMAYAVIALAQYFLKKNTNFFRELPLHIMAMRKYYQQEKSYLDDESIAQAPAAAMQTAMRFFEDMSA